MGDDQAGLVVARRLAERHLPHVTVLATEAPTTVLADEDLVEIGLLLVVDSAPADGQHPAGSSARLDYRRRPEALRAKPQVDTHSISVDAGLALASALDVLPPEVWIYVIFGERFECCLDMGAVVAAGVDPLVDRIECDVRDWIGS